MLVWLLCGLLVVNGEGVVVMKLLAGWAGADLVGFPAFHAPEGGAIS